MVTRSPAGQSGSDNAPRAVSIPSTSVCQAKLSSSNPAVCCRLRTVIIETSGSIMITTGSITFFSSTSPGDGVRSGKSRPSQAKFPPCGSSPKSPPCR